MIFSKFIIRLLDLNRSNKTLIEIIADYICLTLCFWASLSIRINAIYLPTTSTKFLIFLAPLLAIPIFYSFGLYRSLVRYSGFQSMLAIIYGVTVYTLFWFLIVLLSGVVEKPYDFLIINWALTILFIGGVRYAARWLLAARYKVTSNVAIYGAGTAGIQLEAAMKHSSEIKAVAFLDDDPILQGHFIEGLKVYAPSHLGRLIERKGVSEILIAIPSLPRSEMNRLLQTLKMYPIAIKVLPGFSDIVQGRVSVSDLRKINIEDLLKRDIRKPHKKLLNQDIERKNVLVTGAGGSIGRELCQQIITRKPNSLILLDINEFALYRIEQKLLDINQDIKLIPVLGNVKEGYRLKQLIKSFKIQTIFHAAAYKHVPLVEMNAVAGVSTNIFGTLECIKAALACKVESFVFISTDKAVRPTNIMGATKRFAELILQAQAYKQSKTQQIQKKTRISMVRFGNVLGSSGSVVPLFRDQIKKGGPLTVTDPEITRYFMTIAEAAQLVIQAGAMESKGDIFVLDMGEPIKVVNLAKDMIKLSGMTLKNKNNPDGDIEIVYTGLRPGEKLYEELLIGNNMSLTEHEKIMRVREESLDWEDLQKHLVELENAIKMDNVEKIFEVFIKTVSGFIPDKKFKNAD